jgi:hypothetical protein
MAKQPRRGSSGVDTYAISTKESRKSRKRSFAKGKKKKTKKQARGKN